MNHPRVWVEEEACGAGGGLSHPRVKTLMFMRGSVGGAAAREIHINASPAAP